MEVVSRKVADMEPLSIDELSGWIRLQNLVRKLPDTAQTAIRESGSFEEYQVKSAVAGNGLFGDDSFIGSCNFQRVREILLVASSRYLFSGYKGKQAGSSGIIYCPYIPVQAV